ncbi:MAG: bifunctional riboflavin kinase/FAD synthetase [Breznakibacter sp.]
MKRSLGKLFALLSSYCIKVKVHSGTEGFTPTKAVVTIGMFDGLHKGHRLLLQQTVDNAGRIGGESVVITFWPHPRLVLGKDNGSMRFLTSLEERTLMFSRQGIDHLVILPFTKELAALTARQFIQQILISQIGMVHLVVGFDHRFGSDGHLQSPNYENYSHEYGFGVTRVDAVMANGVKASSSTIRQLLGQGRIEAANVLLGYPYTVTGRVVGGQRLGRTIGYPTANIEVGETAKLIPLDGVYACRVRVLGRKFNGMLNIGYRPTVSKQLDFRTIEVHLLDFTDDIYSEEVSVEFVARVRNEMQFQGVEALKAQLMRDEKTIRDLLSQ